MNTGGVYVLSNYCFEFPRSYFFLGKSMVSLGIAPPWPPPPTTLQPKQDSRQHSNADSFVGGSRMLWCGGMDEPEKVHRPPKVLHFLWELTSLVSPTIPGWVEKKLRCLSPNCIAALVWGCLPALTLAPLFAQLWVKHAAMASTEVLLPRATGGDSKLTSRWNEC